MTVILKQGEFPAKIVNRKVVQKCSEAKQPPITNNHSKKAGY